MQKTICCFGCSFTGGVFESIELRESWPYRLSILRPDLDIYNFGRQGTSVTYSLNLLEHVRSTLDPDFIITQITEPTRMTFYDDGFQYDIKKDLLQVSRNYWVLPMSKKGIWPINGIIGKKLSKEYENSREWNEKYKIVEQLMLMQNDRHHFDVEYRAIVQRIISLSNLVFFHKKLVRTVDGINLPCIDDEMGLETFIEMVKDKGYHFGEEGCQWVAEWVNQKLFLDNQYTIDLPDVHNL